MLYKIPVITAIVLTIVIPSNAEVIDSKQEECSKISSCSSCILNSFCTWCVTKSKCTKQSCGNDNIIYPKDISAIMSGPQFCPRVVEPHETLTIKSGAKEVISVQITQIHLYMAFTPWKCEIMVEGMSKPRIVIATLIGDNVFCQVMQFTNESNKPYVNGSVTVLWDYTKSFDGSYPFKVCRCDLDPSCKACTRNK